MFAPIVFLFLISTMILGLLAMFIIGYVVYGAHGLKPVAAVDDKHRAHAPEEVPMLGS